MSSLWLFKATLQTLNIYFIYTLFLFILSLSPITSQQCDNGINNEYIGFYFNPPPTTIDTDPFSPQGLSKFTNITLNIIANCLEFNNPNTSSPPTMYLSITTQSPDLYINKFEDWMDIAIRKAVTLEDIIPDLNDKSQIFDFILHNWDDHLSNLTNETDSFETIPNWYNIWLLEANTNDIASDCNNSYSSDPIETTITFEWKQYTQFFPIFQNFDITNTQTWIDDITNLPYEIIWNNDYINVTSLYYNMVIFNDASEWLKCFKITNIDSTEKDWQLSIDTYYYNTIYSNFSYINSLLDYTLYSEIYIPLIAYNNCNVSYRIPTEDITDNKDKKCYDNTCCKYDGSPHFFNLYFWYDDDVWTNSLALYQLLTQYTIEEALCDIYNEIYPSNDKNPLTPNDFYISVSYFFNFCLLKTGGCPNYDAENKDSKLTFFPPGIDNNDEISGYKMYATFRTRPLDLSEKIYEMLAEDTKNAYKFQEYIIRRAKEDFGRSNFNLFGIAISELPQRIIFKVPQYINYGVWSFVGLCTLFAIVGAIHGFVYWGADCIRISGIIYFGLYTWDFYSDIVFDLELLNYPDTQYLFYLCTAFIAIPWIANMYSLSKYQQKWCKDDAIRERVYSWFVSWQRLTYALAAISGSAFGTVELANSYVFGMDFFCMGLNERHLKRFNNNRLWSGIIAENLPQLIVQFWFLSTLDWEPENSIVWIAIVSSSLSIGAALLDIYSAKKLFDVLEPNGKSLGKVTCSIYILSYEVKQNAKKLQVSTYALRDAIAETLTAHRRSVEMHFPIKTSDGLKIGFTVFSSQLQAKTIYERLRKNCIPMHINETAELPKKIKKVWRLDGPIPELPVKDIYVDGVDVSEYDNENIHFETNIVSKNNNNEGGDIEMVDLNHNNNNNGIGNGIDEGNAIGMMDAFKTVPLNGDSGNKDVSGYDAQIASLNAQIAMNQYLMMKQIERMKDDDGDGGNNDNDSKIKKLQELMMKQMQQMNNMINMSKPYNAEQFQKFNNEWENENENEENVNDNGGDNPWNGGGNGNNNYEPPQLLGVEKKEDVYDNNNEDNNQQYGADD